MRGSASDGGDYVVRRAAGGGGQAFPPRRCEELSLAAHGPAGPPPGRSSLRRLARGRLNTPLVVAGRADPRYRAEALRPPRRIGRHLALFDCINCDKCLPACPNDANFVYEAEPLAREYESYRVEGGGPSPWRAGASRRASATRSPTSRTSATTAATATRSAPRTAGRTSRSPASSARSRPGGSRATRDGFFVERRTDRDAMWGRLRGVEYRLEVDRAADQAVFTDGRVTLELRHRERVPVGASVAPGTPDGHTLDVGRLPDDGRPARRRPRPAPRQPRERDGRRPVNLLLLAPDEVRDDGTAS